ncbi:hypothetical protein PG989_002183 [Apiospora arundinis]
MNLVLALLLLAFHLLILHILLLLLLVTPFTVVAIHDVDFPIKESIGRIVHNIVVRIRHPADDQATRSATAAGPHVPGVVVRPQDVVVDARLAAPRLLAQLQRHDLQHRLQLRQALVLLQVGLEGVGRGLAEGAELALETVQGILLRRRRRRGGGGGGSARPGSLRRRRRRGRVVEGIRAGGGGGERGRVLLRGQLHQVGRGGGTGCCCWQ